MARVDTLGHFLTDVADAIRTKTGSSSSIVASDFDTEIESIPSGGTDDYFTTTLTNGSTSAYDPSGVLKAVKKIPSITAGGDTLAYACNRCTNLTDITITGINSVTTMNNCFNLCTALINVSLSGTFASLTNIMGIFNGCSSLVNAPDFDVSHVTTAQNMFYNASALLNVPQYNFSSSLTNTSSMFDGCKELVSVPLFTMSGVTLCSYMFNGCKKLTTVPQYDLSGITNASNMSNMFNGCTLLSNDSLSNIMNALATATNISSGTMKLKSLGLSSTQATYCASLPIWSTLTSAGWTTGY